MPELPDIEVYLDALRRRLLGAVLEQQSIAHVFVLRTVEPPIDCLMGCAVTALRRVGKRIVLEFDRRYFLVIHLMVAGRLQWQPAGGKPKGKSILASWCFASGTLQLTEAGSKRRASLHLVEGEAALAALDPGGLEPLQTDLRSFATRLQRENHTLKRALTDPRLFSGIGNAYSDEILNDAGLSPLVLTQKLDDEKVNRLYLSTINVLKDWTQKLRDEFSSRFPGAGEITAFRPEFSAHGQYGKPCKRCGTTIQRIRYAENETNYCPKCQTGGKILSDRSMARLLKDDWPRTIEELEG
ncbi:MAG: formamidopyrimidine-DNA glycosylase [Verrucomicrobiae bacterium]|nr:formamidopyrimidine-DNA glycosylase [Verrucomicrobiae bacterium]